MVNRIRAEFYELWNNLPVLRTVGVTVLRTMLSLSLSVQYALWQFEIVNIFCAKYLGDELKVLVFFDWQRRPFCVLIQVSSQ